MRNQTLNDNESNVVKLPDVQAEKDAQQDAAVEYTEVGAAELLADCYATEVRYLASHDSWMYFNGTHWKIDGARGKEAKNHAVQCAINLAKSFETDDNPKAKQHQQKMMNKRMLDAIVSLAGTYKQLSVSREQLDADPYVINTPGGIYDLRTAEKVSDPDPDAFHTRATTVAPDFESPAPMWNKFLHDIFEADTDVIDYMQLQFGHALYGKQLAQVVNILMGDGENGKSELVVVIQEVLGMGENGYAVAASRGLLTSDVQDDGKATPELCKLDGARFASCAELRPNQQFNEGRLKSLTGDVQDARPLFGSSYSFTPSASLFLGTNFEPKVGEGGHGFWRRIVKIPMNYTVPKAERVDDIGTKLAKQEGGQILAWMMRGSAKYHEQGGFGEQPKAIKEATAAYRQDSDSLARFVQERCEFRNPGTQGSSIKKAVFNDAYENYCRENGIEATPRPQVGKRLMKEHPVTYKDKGMRWYEGIGLAAELE